MATIRWAFEPRPEEDASVNFPNVSPYVAWAVGHEDRAQRGMNPEDAIGRVVVDLRGEIGMEISETKGEVRVPA